MKQYKRKQPCRLDYLPYCSDGLLHDHRTYCKLWDCPEFITTGYKLEVGHPPGAPFFMLVANLFSQFASDASTVAKMVNYMSALMSGACILFLSGASRTWYANLW